MIRYLIALLVFAGCGPLHAAPLVNLALEGRAYGSNDNFNSTVPVRPGDTVEYRLRLLLGPPTIPIDEVRRNDLGTILHGVNSLSLNVVQDPEAAIQVDFANPASLAPRRSTVGVKDGWGEGVGARGGSPTTRGTSAAQDLLDIRPIHGPGVFTAWDWETVLTGTFEVTEVSGPSGTVDPVWGPSPGGAYRNGGTHFFLPRNEGGPDSLAHFAPLTLTAAGLNSVPEPATLALVAVALLCAPCLRRRSASTAA